MRKTIRMHIARSHTAYVTQREGARNVLSLITSAKTTIVNYDSDNETEEERYRIIGCATKLI